MSERKEVPNRQVWEYAYIKWRGFGPDNSNSSLNYLPTEENKAKNKIAEPGGMFSKPTDYQGIFRTWVVELGQEGYEMTGISSFGNQIEYWFKRPK